MINNAFSPKRFGLYLKKEFFLNLNTILVASGTILGLLLVFFLLSIQNLQNTVAYSEFFQVMYVLGLVGGGLIYTSSIFKELNQQGKSYFFLTLPVSTFEKFLSAFFFTAIAWSLFYTLLFFIFAAVAGEIQSTFYETPYMFIDFNSFKLFIALRGYIVAQSLFLLGATIFRGRTFIKTGLALFLIGIICMILFLFMNWIVLNDFLVTYTNNTMNAISMTIHKGMTADMEWINPLSNAVANYAVAPIAWVTAYFKLKEREI
ncbi:MAG: hypothetical protein ACEPOZ_03560 [Marinifilaceae bacterium]